MPGSEAMDDCKEFLVIDVVVVFSRIRGYIEYR